MGRSWKPYDSFQLLFSGEVTLCNQTSGIHTVPLVTEIVGYVAIDRKREEV